MEVIINVQKYNGAQIFFTPMQDIAMMQELIALYIEPVCSLPPILEIKNSMKLQHCEIKPEIKDSFFFHFYPNGLNFDDTMGMQKKTIEKIIAHHDYYNYWRIIKCMHKVFYSMFTSGAVLTSAFILFSSQIFFHSSCNFPM